MEWIRTNSGWRPLSELHKSLTAQIVSHFRHFKSKKSKSRSSSPSNEALGSSTTSEDASVSGSLSEGKAVLIAGSSPTSSGNLHEKYLKQLYFLLSMKCISIGGTSRESNQYASISDAIHKMGFQHALQDENCFPFICKVLILVFDGHYESCSGSLQLALMRILDSAKDIAIVKQLHSNLVLKAIEKALAANEKARRVQYSGYGLRIVDSKIKSLLKMKQQVQESQCVGAPDVLVVEGAVAGTQLLHLPSDCLLHIASYLSEPRDVLNLGLTSIRLHGISNENEIWRGLIHYHYGLVMKVGQFKLEEYFIQCYKVHSCKLREEMSSVVRLCRTCNHIFWKSYGHPCCNSVGSSTTSLTPQNFIQFFTY